MPVSMNFQWAIRAIQASKRKSSLWEERLKPCWCHPQCWAKTGGLLYWSMPGFIKQHIGNCQTSEGCHNIDALRGLLGPPPIDSLCSQCLWNNIKERHKRWSHFHFQCNVHYFANTTVGSVLPYRGRQSLDFGSFWPQLTCCLYLQPLLPGQLGLLLLRRFLHQAHPSLKSAVRAVGGSGWGADWLSTQISEWISRC